MKLSTLAIATLAITAVAGSAAFAQTDAGSAQPGPAVTMQPIPNPPEAAKPMAMKHKAHKKHKSHAKADTAAAAPAAAPSK